MIKDNAVDYCEFKNIEPKIFDSNCPRNLKCSRNDDIAFLNGFKIFRKLTLGLIVKPTETVNSSTAKSVVNGVPFDDYLIA